MLFSHNNKFNLRSRFRAANSQSPETLGPLLTPEQIVKVTLEHPEMGTYHISTAVFRLSKCSNKPRSPAPLLGEHNEYILREFLNMSDDEIADLAAEEVLQ